MYSEIKISELKDIENVEHRVITDGLTYELDKYIFTVPVEMELKGINEHINFNSPVREIHRKYWIPEATFGLELILESNCENKPQIHITYSYNESYRIRIYENATERENYMNNINIKREG